MKRIFLIGYMGTGKTTVGRELATVLDLEFVDLDHFIQGRYQKTIGQLFEEVGEDKFREIESNVLHEVADFENVVVSTGGGTPCFFDNMECMNAKGITVYLKASPEALCARLSTCKEKRPLIRDKNDEELYSFVVENLAKRESMYSQAKLIHETEELVSREDVDAYVQKLIEKL